MMISFESFKQVEVDHFNEKTVSFITNQWLVDKFGLRSRQESIERKVIEHRKIVKHNLKRLMKL